MIVFMVFIRYGNGRLLEGVILSFGDRVVRVAIKGSDDAAEFRMIRGVWVSEDCEVVRLEFAGQGAPVEVHDGDDFLEAMLTAATAVQPVPRVM
jgi:hypothetical protein